MDLPLINITAERLLNKIKHLLIAHTGKIEKETSNIEFYQAFSLALKDEIMMNWVATMKTFKEKKVRSVNLLSMEYLPGKMLLNNITNLEAMQLVEAILSKSNRVLSDLIECDPDLGLGNGGLGRLASCFLDSLATLNYPAFAYGLRYQYGIFEQEIWNGVQVERPDCWLLNEYPWEWRRDSFAESAKFRGRLIEATNRHGDRVFHVDDFEEVRAIPYDIPIIGFSRTENFSVLTLRLWSTKESPKNFELQRYNAGQLDQASENTSLTDVLYPNDNHETGKRIRLKQEFLLACCSLQDIIKRHLLIFGDILNFGDKVRIQINDTHPSFIIAELVRRLTTNHDVSWEKAWEITQQVINFTNHTILKESLEEWNEKRVAYFLPRQYKIIQKLNEIFCNKIRNTFPNDEERVRRMSFIEHGQIRMAYLAHFASNKVNGVSFIHSEILKNVVFKDFHELYPHKIVSITNGITLRRWMLNSNPHLAALITKYIGEEWIVDFSQIQKLHEIASNHDLQEEFLAIKKANKELLFDFLSKQNPIRDYNGKIIDHSPILATDALVEVQIKRIHEYKRQLMNALHLLMIYNDIKNNSNARKMKRMVIFGGKAAPGYETAKQIVRLIFCVARKINADPACANKIKVVFVENYNVSKAEKIIPAADLSHQISTAGKEASGTGNMKLAINGALTIGTEDGSTIEMRKSIGDKWWPFSFGLSVSEIQQYLEKGQNPAWEIYLGNEKIRRAIDMLKDGSLSKTQAEHDAFLSLYEKLLDGYESPQGDPYFVIADLMSYYETQKKAEEMFLDSHKWAEYAIHNIAGMGPFSSDTVIRNYAQSIWELERCPIDSEVLKKVREEFATSLFY